MSVPPRELRQLRRGRRGESRAAVRRRRLAAVAPLAAVLIAAVIVIVASGGGSSASSAGAPQARASQPGRSAGHGRGATRANTQGARGTGIPGHATVPILMYHVINPPPASVPYPGLYVPAG